MHQLELAVTGMGCGGCVKHVRDALSAVPGVVVHDVSIGKAVVQFDSQRSSESVVGPVVPSDQWIGECFRHEPGVSSRPRSESDHAIRERHDRNIAIRFTHVYRHPSLRFDPAHVEPGVSAEDPKAT